MGIYVSTKKLELGSCAFRQWKSAPIRCSKIHGYQLTTKIWFGCSELDHRQWCVNFGDLKPLKDILQNQFDHTMCVAEDDPELEVFRQLHDRHVLDLRVMEGVGIERTAEWVFNAASEYIKERYGDRCWIEKVEVFEHEANSAIYMKPIEHQKFNTSIAPDEKYAGEVVAETPVEQVPEPVYNNDRSAPVGRKSTPGIGDLYAGTIWG